MPIEGQDNLERLLTERIPEEIRRAAADAIERGAKELVAVMKQFVPSDEGKLRDSIGWTFGSAPKGSVTISTVGTNEVGRISATIFAGDETTLVYNARGIAFQNALLQEFGTKGGVPASNYFFGTYRALKRRVQSRITREIRKAIRSTFANG